MSDNTYYAGVRISPGLESGVASSPELRAVIREGVTRRLDGDGAPLGRTVYRMARTMEGFLLVGGWRGPNSVKRGLAMRAFRRDGGVVSDLPGEDGPF